MAGHGCGEPFYAQAMGEREKGPGATQAEPARGRIAWGVVSAAFVASVLARSLDFFRVFVAEREVVFAAGDAFYHARRARATFEDFPALLRFDPCINFPDGAFVPHPPLLDWGTALVAHAFGGTLVAFEWTAAWMPVVLSSLAVFPIHALGRRLFDARVAGLAVAIYAAMPILINYGQLGNFDHHAPAGLIGACLILLYARALEPDARGPRHVGALVVALVIALVIARLAMLLTWTGSLLYLLPGEAALVLFATDTRDARRLRSASAGWLATALLAGLFAAVLRPVPDPFPFTAVEFSHLHGLIYAALAVLGFSVAGFLTRRSDASRRQAHGVLFGAGALLVLGALALPGIREALGQGLGFLAADDGYTETVVEQLPLFFGEGAYSFAIAHARMGGFAYLIPLVPIAFFLQGRAPARQPQALYLAGFSLLLAYLAFGQVRYAHDLAPLACVGMAWWVFRAAAWISERIGGRPGSVVCAALLATALWLPTLPGFFLPVTGLLASGLRGELDGIDRALLSVAGSQLRFAQTVDEATPESGRCATGHGDAPAYGVLAHVGLGHALHYGGRRATPADPFGPYIGPANFAAVAAFFAEHREASAVERLDRLRTPFVATAADALERPKHAMAYRLHVRDGSFESGVPALGRFRLVTEGPLGGRAMDELFGGDLEGFAPYKLFERVAGADLQAQTPPGALLTVELPLKTPTGRRFVYRAAVRASASGTARVRLPYASPRAAERIRLADRVARTTALGSYAVEVDGRRHRVHVEEEEVRTGRRLDLADYPARDRPAPRPGS